MGQKQDTEEQAVREVEPEWDRVKRWRQAELERAGFHDDLAQVIAACPDIDLHKAVDMVENGCNPSIAALILL